MRTTGKLSRKPSEASQKMLERIWNLKSAQKTGLVGLATKLSVERPCQSMNLRVFPPKTPGSSPKFYLHLKFSFLWKRTINRLELKRSRKLKHNLEFVDS